MVKFFYSLSFLLICCMQSRAQSPLVIQVGYAPLPNVTTNAGIDSTICEGQSLQLFATGTGGLGALAYGWQPAAGLSNANVANPTANPSQSTTYTLTTTDNRGCFDTDQLLITVVTCASVGENKSFGINIYPNPAAAAVQISWDAQNQVQRLVLKDMQGRIVQQILQPEGASLELFTAELAKGLYFVEINFAATKITEKLILH